MPFLLINPHNKKNIKYYFPDTNQFCVNNYKEFKKKINSFLKKPQFYNEYWEKLSFSIR